MRRALRSFFFRALCACALALAFLPALCWAQDPEPCPSGHFCYDSTLNAADRIPCIPSQYCPGDQPAQLCDKGFYCPDPTQRIECPSGHYCPPGSIVPRGCSALAWCPACSERYLHWGALVLLALMLPVLLAAQWIYERVNSWVNRAHPPVANVQRRPSMLEMAAMQHSAPNGASAASNDDANPADAASASLQSVPRMDIRFRNLAAAVDVHGVSKTILEDVTGHFRPGRLVAVMGPSGAGKSSLINVLTGEVGLQRGSIAARIEGALEGDLARLRRQGLIGVVPQADIMLPMMTPRDILTHSAFTRLPADWSAERKRQRVDDTLRVLDLQRVQHSPVGDENVRGVSGGEKKRVNVGIELVNSPSLLILDEPTTGLDSSTSASLLQTLRSITRLNTTVVAVLHQPRPEIFRSIDDLLLLAPGGRTVYFGPAALTQQYFERVGFVCDSHTNPSDFFIDVIAADKGQGPVIPGCKPSSAGDVEKRWDAKSVQAYLVEQWKGDAGRGFRSEHRMEEAEEPVEQGKESPRFKHDVQLPSLLSLTWLYTFRGGLQLLRSVSTLQLELSMHALAGGVIGMAFVQDNWFLAPLPPAYAAYCPPPLQKACAQDALRDQLGLMSTYTVMAVGLVAAIVGNRCYGQELLNMQREASAGLSPSAYFLGKALAELPLIVLYSFVYCVSFYLVCSPAALFHDFYLALLLFEFVLFSLGYVCSLLLSGENALLLSAIGALLSGLATDARSAEKDANWARWLSEALVLSEARLDLQAPPLDAITEIYLRKRNGFVPGNYAKDMAVLLLMGVVLRLMAYGLVWKKFRK